MSERMISLAEIRDVLPCKDSFLFLERVQQIDENHYIALKAVTITELHFIGHFPNHPIMPGVLEVEAIAQLGELAVWKRLDPERKYDLYVKSLANVKFRRENNPGDRMLIDVQITNITDSEASLTATITNNSGVACQAEMTLGLREKEWNIAIPKLFNEYDKCAESPMDVNTIMSHIPHRFPFLFVDYIAKIDGAHFTGIKNTTQSDPVFREYKDGYSVMTSSVHPEIAAQAGCIYMLSNEACKGKIAFFMGIDYSEFIAPVHPGDQMRLEVDMPVNIKKVGKGEGCIYVEDRLISKTQMKFAIVDP